MQRIARKNQFFHHLLFVFYELAPAGSEEKELMEKISTHVGKK
jgi:hypothetical protein